MPLTEVMTTSAILFAGVVLQTGVGFGIGLVCVPLLLWTGWSLPAAVATVLGAGFVQALVGVAKTRRPLREGPTLRVAIAQWLMAPVGALVMSTIVALGAGAVRQAVGAVLVVVLTVRLLVRPVPRAKLHPSYSYLAGGAGGLLASMVGMGGPPIVLFALAHDWDKRAFRGFLWLQFLLGTPVVLGALVHRVGTELLMVFVTALAFAPVIALGTWAGLHLTARWKTRHLSLAALVMLYAIAGASLVSPWLSSS